MDQQDRYYMPEEVPASWKFELLGHAEKTLGESPILNMLDIDPNMPNKQYPDWVVPIGKLDGRLASTYLQRSGVVKACWVVEVSPNPVRYNAELREKLSGYDYRRHCLFAFSRDEVIYHENTREEELKITRMVLSDERFRETDPFMRLHIATSSKDRELVLSEFQKSIKHLWHLDKDYCRAMYPTLIDCMKRPEEQLGDGMPELAQMLEQPGMLESLLAEEDDKTTNN